jgi:hypothetical protein
MNKTIVNFKGTSDENDNIATRMIFKEVNKINPQPQKEFHIDYDSNENSLKFKAIDETSTETSILTLSKNTKFNNLSGGGRQDDIVSYVKVLMDDETNMSNPIVKIVEVNKVDVIEFLDSGGGSNHNGNNENKVIVFKCENSNDKLFIKVKHLNIEYSSDILYIEGSNDGENWDNIPGLLEIPDKDRSHFSGFFSGYLKIDYCYLRFQFHSSVSESGDNGDNGWEIHIMDIDNPSLVNNIDKIGMAKIHNVYNNNNKLVFSGDISGIYPDVSDALSLGDTNHKWNELYIDKIVATSEVSVGGSLQLSPKKLYSTAVEGGSGFAFNANAIVPINNVGSNSNDIDLGNDNSRWNELYINNIVATRKVSVGGSLQLSLNQLYSTAVEGGSGFAFNANAIVPVNNTGSMSNEIYLGNGYYRWRYVYATNIITDDLNVENNVYATNIITDDLNVMNDVNVMRNVNAKVIELTGYKTIEDFVNGSMHIMFNNMHATLSWDNMNIQYGIKSQYSILCNSTIISTNASYFSDKRIKTNIVDVPDNLALQQVRDLPCRYYEYKDVVNRGTDKTIGYIAQEVKEVIPMAVNEIVKIIPNEYHIIENPVWEEITDISGNVKFNLIMSPTDFSDNTYMNEDDVTDISGIKYEFYVTNDLSRNETRLEITGNPDNRSFTFENKWNHVFIYGREVNDFLVIDKAKICALHHASIQEIDRLQTQNTEKISTLETENESLRSRVTELETQLAQIKQHLNLNS